MKPDLASFNRSLAATFFSCFLLGTTSVTQAADSQSYTINLTASVPADSFQVIPVDAGWINQTQEMGYDIATSKLKVFQKQFQYKNTAGAIQATLTGNLTAEGKPQLSNGSDVIPLTVTFNNVALSNTATTVISESAAKAGGRTDLKIAQADSKALVVNGSFSGSVAMIFEPVVAVTP